MWNRINREEKKIQEYLSGKYQKEFTFEYRGNDVWTSQTNTYHYLDDQNRAFVVEEERGHYYDNYGAVLYGAAIDQIVQEDVGSARKAYASTSMNTLGEVKGEGPREYLAACSMIQLNIYTKEESSADAIVELFGAKWPDKNVFVRVFCLTEEAFQKASSYNDEFRPGDYLWRESFWSRQGEVSGRTREEARS